MPEAPRERTSRDDLVSALLRVGLIALLLLLAWWLVDVLLLTFAGVLIAVFLRAPADWLASRTKLSGNLSIAIVFVVLTLVLGGAGFAMAPEIGRQVDELTQRVPEAARELTGSLQQYGWGRWL
ncbi:MAG TPA: AI-2E family transporter, partial [Nannocystis sp.]